MADSQVLTISYGGVQVSAQVVGGMLQVTLPAATLVDTDGKARALDLAFIQKIIELVLQLLPLLFGGGL